MMGNRVFGKGVAKVEFSSLSAFPTNFMIVPGDI